MRQRKAKDLEKRLQECSQYLLEEASLKDFGGKPGRNLYLEIGCGKGQFAVTKARENPDSDYIAIEGQETVILRGLEKAMAEPAPLDNLKFTCCFVNSMEELFDENTLSGVYLNFSDPWPKARHAKRRLTYHKRLADYAWAIKPGGFIEIKTDNDGLFEFTLEEIELCGPLLETVEMTRDLHGASCSYGAAATRTEYEDKFISTGKNINYVKVLVRK